MTKLKLAKAERHGLASTGPDRPPSAHDHRDRRSSAPEGKRAGRPEQDSVPATVELRNVSHGYKGFRALSSVSLSIRPGEFFSLLGPSGCGKTTTLNVIGGFVFPDEGEVLISGKSVGRVPAYRRPVNTVFQNYALFPHLTVAQNIAFGPRMARQVGPAVARRVDEALALVSLSGLGDRRPDQLSGGQQQRVALARALINRPTVLLLDEPLGALDLKLRKQMQLELSRIQREVGITFVYVTHDQEEALSMSDRIAVMESGSVAQIGAPQDVYEHPASLFVADFIGSSNKVRGEILDVAAGNASVRVNSGSVISVPAASSAWKGRSITVVVRPDHAAIALQPPENAENNALPGRVAKVAYLGTHREVDVVLADGSGASVRQSLTAQNTQPAPEAGDQVFVVWPIAKSIGFPTPKSGDDQGDRGNAPQLSRSASNM